VLTLAHMERPWLKHYGAEVPAHLSYPQVPLHQLLIDSARRFPRHSALEFYGRRISYRELNELTDRFASALIDLGLKKGDRMAIMLPNIPQTVIGYFGALKAGVCVVQTNPLYVAQELTTQLTDAGAETVLALDLFYPRIQEVMQRIPLKRVILTGVKDYLPWLKRLLYPLKARREKQTISVERVPPIYDFAWLMKQASSSHPQPTISADDIALLQYTGGTTGIPKGVMLTHRSLVANAMQCRHWLYGLREGEERFLGVLPFFHVYGMTACQNLVVLLGASVVLLPRFQTEEVLKTVTKRRITAFPGIPSMFSAMSNHPRMADYDLRSVRFCITGAGPLYADVRARFEKASGAHLVEGYGLTEAAPVTHCTPIDGQAELRCIGLPVPDTDARVVDCNNRDRVLPPGDVGELQVKGPQVMQGYWNHPEETAAVLHNGWLSTGDMVSMDGRGFFYIHDRKKDMIKSGGENVYPREVDECLMRHPKVKEACVVGIPQDLRGERIKAFVVLKEDQEATPAEILEHCRQHLAKFKVPKQVEFRKELPKTLVGKVLRRALLEDEMKRLSGNTNPNSPPALHKE
jgi:long-chain acyl-CoA synthetase